MINDVVYMKLKVYHGIEKCDYEYGVVSVSFLDN